MTEREPKACQLRVAVTAADRERLDAEARRRDVPVSQLVREALRERLARTSAAEEARA